jgi:hypothetical protein
MGGAGRVDPVEDRTFLIWFCTVKSRTMRIKFRLCVTCLTCITCVNVVTLHEFKHILIVVYSNPMGPQAPVLFLKQFLELRNTMLIVLKNKPPWTDAGPVRSCRLQPVHIGCSRHQPGSDVQPSPQCRSLSSFTGKKISSFLEFLSWAETAFQG